jgi:hypothetical protein
MHRESTAQAAKHIRFVFVLRTKTETVPSTNPCHAPQWHRAHGNHKTKKRLSHAVIPLLSKAFTCNCKLNASAAGSQAIQYLAAYISAKTSSNAMMFSA